MAADNDYPAMFAGVSSPYVGGQSVTPSDTVSLTKVSRALYVCGTGNLSVLMMDGTTVTIPTVPAYTLLPLRVERVNFTGTSATNIRALW
jgi:hypothetical protein